MAFISDIMIISGTLIVALYCGILSRRLKRLTGLDSEVGQVIRKLSDQIEALAVSVETASQAGKRSVANLRKETKNAEDAARHLELLIASLHGLPQSQKPESRRNPFYANKEMSMAKVG